MKDLATAPKKSVQKRGRDPATDGVPVKQEPPESTPASWSYQGHKGSTSNYTKPRPLNDRTNTDRPVNTQSGDIIKREKPAGASQVMRRKGLSVRKSTHVGKVNAQASKLHPPTRGRPRGRPPGRPRGRPKQIIKNITMAPETVTNTTTEVQPSLVKSQLLVDQMGRLNIPLSQLEASMVKYFGNHSNQDSVTSKVEGRRVIGRRVGLDGRVQLLVEY